MINPYLLQLLAMRNQMAPWGSTASDYPGETFGMPPWNVPPALGQPGGPQPPMAPDAGTPPAEVVGAPSPVFDEVFDEKAAHAHARREGLGALGVALLAGAGRGDFAGSLAEGLAAMAATTRQRYQDEQNQFRQTAQERLARETYDRQNRLTDAQIKNYGADNDRARLAAEAQAKEREAEITHQQNVVAHLPPEQRDRLAPLVGTKDFYSSYWEVTKPAPTPKPEEPLHIGRELVVKGDDGKYHSVYTAPAEPSSPRMSTEDAAARAAAIADAVETVRERHGKGVPSQEQIHDDVAAEADRRYGNWLKQRMQGVGERVPADKQVELVKKGFKGFPIKKGPTEMKLRFKGRDGQWHVMTEDEYMHEKFRLEAEAAVRQRQRLADRQRSDMIIDLDAYGNEVP